MQKMKVKAFRVLSISIVLILISGFISVQGFAKSEIIVSGIVEKGKIQVELTSDIVADTIIINIFSDGQHFAEQFVGFNFVYPGLSACGDFIITNNTGQVYKVTDFSFEAYVESIRRVYNDAAVNKYGVMTDAGRDIVKSLSGEEWYQLNAEYYGLESLYDIEVARKLLGYGDSSQGIGIGIETSPEIIALAEWYLFNKSQFSFNTEKYPINNLDVKNITLQDYIDKTPDNKAAVLNNCFSQEIGEDGFAATIGYSIDNPGVGNAYNGADSDFRFTLTLSRVADTTVPTPTEPTPTEPAPTEPTPTEPAPTEPAPTEPTPTTAPLPPAPTHPEPEATPPEEIEITDPDTPKGGLDDVNHIKYIQGYPDGSVRPDRYITRAETASIFFRLLTDSSKNDACSSTFNDVSGDRWYSQAVNYLAYKGVIKGYADGSYKPDASITRAEFAAVAARLNGLTEADESVFADVPNDHWAVLYINSAYKKGWVNGYGNGAFKPEQHITRVEVVKLVNTMLSRHVKPEDLDDNKNPFNDLTRDYWGFAHILEASSEHSYTRSDDGFEIWRTGITMLTF